MSLPIIASPRSAEQVVATAAPGGIAPPTSNLPVLLDGAGVLALLILGAWMLFRSR